MSKAELVEEIVNQRELTGRESTEAVDAITSVITDALAREEQVTSVGFGTFQVIKRKVSKRANPRTGEVIRIPGKTLPRYLPGKSLKEKNEVRRKR